MADRQFATDLTEERHARFDKFSLRTKWPKRHIAEAALDLFMALDEPVQRALMEGKLDEVLLLLGQGEGQVGSYADGRADAQKADQPDLSNTRRRRKGAG